MKINSVHEFRLCLVLLLVTSLAAQPAEYWKKLGHDAIQKTLNIQPNENRAKNVIIFIGDGMDITTLTASRIYKGQLKGNTGEEESMIWETFPNVALSKTYNTDKQVPDSAGTATAILTGVKTRYGTIGFDGSVVKENCASEKKAIKGTSIIDYAIAEGKSSGVITTARLTHATPASVYAHTCMRHWECDSDISEEGKENGCEDIASQLVPHGVQIAMGGGRRSFLPEGVSDPEYTDKTGRRMDGRNLIDEWLENKRSTNRTPVYVWNKDQFDAVDPNDIDALLGLFEWSHMNYEKERSNDTAGEPSLAEMVEKAIAILSKNEDGFVLVVEGGRIDHGHHAGIAHSALTETQSFETAVEKALELTNRDDTLIIVTADHAHVMTMAGYPSRGNPILGLVDGIKGDDGLPYTTLGYMNGYGFKRVNESFHATNRRPDLTNVDTQDPWFPQDALVPLYEEWEETHGGQDVGIFAIGPMAHLIRGVQEQTYIAHVMKYASCIGENKEHCNAGSSLKSTAAMISVLLFSLWWII